MIKECVILLGGNGKRLYPITKAYNKHLVELNGKPFFYYSLSIPILLGIKNIYLVVNAKDKKIYQNFFGNGKKIGINIYYLIQPKSEGIPSAINLAKNKIKNKFLVILGDNFLYGASLINQLKDSINSTINAGIFLKYTDFPERYGIAKIVNNKIVQIKEKPKKYISNNAIIGFYIFDIKFFDYFKLLHKSQRGETEIIDIIYHYLKNKELDHYLISKGSYWNDTGTHREILNTTNFIYQIESSGLNNLGYIEYFSFLKGNISLKKFKTLVNLMPDSEYKFKNINLLNNVRY